MIILSFTYRPRAIDRIKQELFNGNVIQVVGHTGSGKTYDIMKACEELSYSCITLTDEYINYPKLDFNGNTVVLHLDHPSYWYDGTDKTFKSRGLVIIEEDKPRYNVYTIWADTPPLSFFVSHGVNERNWWKLVVGGQDVKGNNYREMLVQAFNRSDFTDITNEDIYTIWDTGIRNYYGIQLLYFIQLMTLSDKFSDLKMLNGLKLVKKITDVDNTMFYKFKEIKGKETQNQNIVFLNQNV